MERAWFYLTQWINDYRIRFRHIARQDNCSPRQIRYNKEIMNRPIKQIKQIKQQGKLLRIFWQALAVATVVVSVKFVLHRLGWEPIEQSSLHNSVISSV